MRLGRASGAAACRGGLRRRPPGGRPLTARIRARPRPCTGRAAADRTSARIRDDFFDASVLQIKREDIVQFLEALHGILIAA